ncbi:GNAT family N-acetyltransferase [Cellulosimicrobium arenosum]|uniref:GNAT family N-acetyltransferase n=1 Tax=Cellulosimicrobium arenosum TaxID=2708133 RepID=A0A927IZK2_9MICO|nr:GNAT family N-acetyltransferase [Cellulosimicrobium arenosum]MBD8079476.1 GNAT family N-acetyltransferase [Cellulosimicrobium arenosum]
MPVPEEHPSRATGLVVGTVTAADVQALAAREAPGADIAVRAFARQREGRSHHVAAWLGGRPVATAEVVISDPPELRNLQVEPEARGRGVGSAVVTFAEQLCLPYGRLALGVAIDNPGARRLYERLGYVGTGRLTTTTYTYVDHDGEHQTSETDEAFEKDLPVRTGTTVRPDAGSER